MGADPKNTPASPLQRMLSADARAGRGARRAPVAARRRRGRASSAAGGTRAGRSPEAALPRRPAGRRPARPTTGGSRVRTLHPVRRHGLAADVVLLAQRSGRGARRRPRSRRQRARGATPRTTSPRSSSSPSAATPVAPAPCRRRWPTCRSARRSARWCTRSSSTPTREAADLRAELLGHIDEQLGPVAGRRSTSTCSPTRWSRSATRRSDRSRTASRCATSPLRDRLREMDFELPLAGGDVRGQPAAAVTLGDVAPLLRAHLPATATRCCPTPRRSRRRRSGDQQLRGYLTGSVDVVLRLPAATARATSSSTTRPTGWAACRAPRRRSLAPTTTAPPRCGAAMAHSDYPLQALLYAVVLHRFLRWRQPGYDPRAAPRRRALPLPPRHVRPRHAARRRRAVRGLRVAAAGARWSRSSRTCWTVGCPA